jgi:anti-sigma B factor antagonist
VDVRLSGSCYVEDAGELRETLVKAAEEGGADFHFDFSGLDYIDSSGLGVLISIQKRAAKNGGKVHVTGLQGLVKELFELTRLVKVFEIE